MDPPNNSDNDNDNEETVNFDDFSEGKVIMDI